MNRDDFNALRDGHYQTIVEINRAKGKDYAGDDDVISNFKQAASDLGIDPEVVWAVYAGKHWSAVMSFCKAGQVESEPIEGRLHDVILYCFLLLGLIEERKVEDRRQALLAVEAAEELGGQERMRCADPGDGSAGDGREQRCQLEAGHPGDHRHTGPQGVTTWG